jgi:hypothetical protein
MPAGQGLETKGFSCPPYKQKDDSGQASLTPQKFRRPCNVGELMMHRLCYSIVANCFAGGAQKQNGQSRRIFYYFAHLTNTTYMLHDLSPPFEPSVKLSLSCKWRSKILMECPAITNDDSVGRNWCCNQSATGKRES